MEVIDLNIIHLLEETPGPWLVEFYSGKDQSHELLAPELIEIARKFDGLVQLRRINCLDHPDLEKRWGIRHLPALAIFSSGKLTWFHEGLILYDQLERQIELSIQQGEEGGNDV